MSSEPNEADPFADGQGPIFSYEEAFSRNLGWLTDWEQQALRGKCVAIPGMGGVGGVHLQTLARFGIGKFHVADFDRFELANFNRQVGATMDSIGRPKVDVMAERALQINPELKITRFPRGVTEENLDEFLAGVDVLIDGLDFFVLDIRRKVFARCAERGIPVITAGPLGMGTAYLVFRPGGMTFEEWFCLEGLSEVHQYINWYVGLSPSMLQSASLVDPSRIDFANHRGPSTAAGCELCAGVASVEAVKLMLGRGPVRAVPYYHHFDAYRGRHVVKKLRGGNRHPKQRLKIALLRRMMAARASETAAPPEARLPVTDIEKILDLARWAPSGDNVQPWRFECVDDSRIVVHVKGTGDIYDFNDCEPTLLAAGFLLETLRIAASCHGRETSWNYLGKSNGVHRIAVNFMAAPEIAADELASCVALRSVDRNAYRLTKLSAGQKATLAQALGDGFTVTWHESLGERWHACRSNSATTDIRLRAPEANDVHMRIIDWERKFSPTGLPGTAIGLDPLAQRLVRWAMRDWRRVKLMNRLAGTGLARLEMDLIPGLCAAAHFTISEKTVRHGNKTPENILVAGQALQRFWLTATKLGLVLQPTFAAQCFAFYGRNRIEFSQDPRLLAKAEKFAAAFDRHAPVESDRIIFRGRIGVPKNRSGKSRSIRRGFGELLLTRASDDPIETG